MNDTPQTDHLQEIEVTVGGIPVTMQVDEADKGKYEHLITPKAKARSAPENKAVKPAAAKA